MPPFLRTAAARWDTALDPANPGWVVDCTFSDGSYAVLVPPPSHYDAPRDAPAAAIVAVTLAAHGLSWDEEETTEPEPH